MTLFQISIKIIRIVSLSSVLSWLACASQPKQTNTSSADRVGSISSPSSSLEPMLPLPAAIREYTLDITKTANPYVPGDQTKVFRIVLQFAVPKVEPENARDPHIVNRTLWLARKELTQCFYQASNRQLTDEKVWVAWIELSPKGLITETGVETNDDWLNKMSGLNECMLGAIKKLSFPEASQSSKVRFRLKLQMIDATGRSDIRTPKIEASAGPAQAHSSNLPN